MSPQSRSAESTGASPRDSICSIRSANAVRQASGSKSRSCGATIHRLILSSLPALAKPTAFEPKAWACSQLVPVLWKPMCSSSDTSGPKLPAMGAAVGGAIMAGGVGAERRNSMNGDRSLRILFVVRPGTLLRFALLVPQIAERGHAIHFAFGRKPEGRVRRFLEPVMGRYPNVTYDVAPVRRETEGWCHVAWLVRLLGDVGRYAHPRYDAAPVLRKRMAKRGKPPPVSEEIDLLKSARRLRIPTGICVGSWDKLTNKGMIKFVPERVFVWNDVQVREAVELHAIPR